MKNSFSAISLSAAFLLLATGCASTGKPELVRTMADQAPAIVQAYSVPEKHCAFTSLIPFQDGALCSFREAKTHLTFDGEIVILFTPDGKTVEPFARLSLPGYDLRDPKLLVGPDNTLFLYCGSVDQNDKSRRTTQSLVYTSADGKNWQKHDVKGLDKGAWLWQSAYNGKNFYSAAYRNLPDSHLTQVSLYRSQDGINLEKIFDLPTENANETWLDFDPATGTLYGLIRTETLPHFPQLMVMTNPDDPATATFKTLPFTLQGPFLKRLDNGCLLIGRRWDIPEEPYKLDGEPIYLTHIQAIWLGDDGSMEIVRDLPSCYDCSYADYAQLTNGTDLVSYYSGHRRRPEEHKTDIYFARWDK